MLLRPHPDAAINSSTVDRGMHRKVFQVFEDLRGKLASWRQDEDSRRSGTAARFVHQPIENRQQKSRGLPAARLGAGEKVAAFECWRNGVGLNRRRTLEPQVLHAAKEIGMELQLSKWHW